LLLPYTSAVLRAQVTPFTQEQLSGLFVEMADFEAAIKRVQPSAKREGYQSATRHILFTDSIDSLLLLLARV
jgi:SpoVK/Ycf46/Vps4 family AAA+-type ATPase